MTIKQILSDHLSRLEHLQAQSPHIYHQATIDATRFALALVEIASDTDKLSVQEPNQ